MYWTLLDRSIIVFGLELIMVISNILLNFVVRMPDRPGTLCVALE
jgi:hypothetical protein